MEKRNGLATRRWPSLIANIGWLCRICGASLTERRSADSEGASGTQRRGMTTAPLKAVGEHVLHRFAAAAD